MQKWVPKSAKDADTIFLGVLLNCCQFAGKKRELHVSKELDVANFIASPEPRQPLRVKEEGIYILYIRWNSCYFKGTFLSLKFSSGFYYKLLQIPPNQLADYEIILYNDVYVVYKRMKWRR